MDKAAVASLVAYNFWANHRILTACARISADEYTRPVAPDPGWGSLRGILVHTLDTEYGWRSILLAREGPILTEADLPDLPALRAHWDAEQAAWQEYMAGLDPQRVSQGYGTDPGSGPRVWQTIVHVVNHGTHHRSEAAAILTGYGQSPGQLDFDEFLKECPEHMRG